MSRKGVVIFGAGLLQKPLIDAAKARGWYTIIVDQNPDALAAQSGDLFVEIPGNDPEALVDVLWPHRDKFHFAATLGTDLSFFVATINEAFALPGINTRQALVATHKGRMREFLKEHGIAQPDFIVSDQKEELYEWMIQNPGPCVIKPVRNMGARGVLYLSEPGEMSFAFEYALSHSADREVILEQYIEADEFSIDALCFKGKTYATGVADRIIEIKEGRFFIETGHTMPSRFPVEILKEITEVTGRFGEALSSLSDEPYSGALKGDIRLGKDNKIYVGEIAARLSGGFMSTHTYPGAGKNSLVEGYLDLLEGRLPEFIAKGRHEVYPQVAIERAVIAPPGELKSISFDRSGFLVGNSTTKARLEHAFIHYQQGDIIQPLRNNIGKLANFIITAPTYDEAEALAQKIIQEELSYEIAPPVLDYDKIKRQAQKVFSPAICRVCKVCNGVHCSSGIPGMGAPGDMELFRKNSEVLARFHIKKEVPAIGPAALVSGAQKRHTEPASTKNSSAPISQNSANQIDLKTSFLGLPQPFPILPAPITGMQTNLGGAITEFEYVSETRAAAEELGVMALYGDGASPDKYQIGLEAIKQGAQNKNSPGGSLIIKPRRDNREIIMRIKSAQKSGACGWGVDIDAVSIETMKNKKQLTSKKTLTELKELAKASSLPFVIKGVNSLPEAIMACEAGAASIVVSNHGGRVDQNLLPSANALELISGTIKKDFPSVSIWVDGGIRSGEDIFKMLALGADGVLIGRPFAIAITGCGRFGGSSLLARYRDELLALMNSMQIKTIKEITRSMIIPESEL